MSARQTLILAIGIAAISTGGPLVRLASDSPPLATAAWRVSIAAMILVPLCALHRPWRRECFSLVRSEPGALLASGSALALHFALWVPSLDYTSVASSVILVTLSPLFVGLLSPKLIGETVAPRLWAGVALAVIGAATIGWGDASLGPRALFGDALALGGAVAVAFYFIVGRSLRQKTALVPYLTGVYVLAALMLMTLATLAGQAMSGYGRHTWLLLGAMALGPQLLGHGSFNWALRGLSATFVAAVTLGEPVGSTILAWWWLNEPPALRTLAGGVFIFAGLLVAARSEPRAEQCE